MQQFGDNGILTKAKQATYMQSVATLQEWFQEQYVNLSTDDYVAGEEIDNTQLAYVMSYGTNKNWFFRHQLTKVRSVNYGQKQRYSRR